MRVVVVEVAALGVGVRSQAVVVVEVAALGVGVRSLAVHGDQFLLTTSEKKAKAKDAAHNRSTITRTEQAQTEIRLAPCLIIICLATLRQLG